MRRRRPRTLVSQLIIAPNATDNNRWLQLEQRRAELAKRFYDNDLILELLLYSDVDKICKEKATQKRRIKMIDATRPIFAHHDRGLWDTKIPKMSSGTTLKILYFTINVLSYMEMSIEYKNTKAKIVQRRMQRSS